MKLNGVCCFFIVVLFIIVVGSLVGTCTNYVPYSKEEPYAKFENMTGMSPAPISPVNYADINPGNLPGFDGVYLSPDIDMPIDVFGDSRGSVDCTRTNLSTSTGFICLNPNQVKLLQTRGGNST